MAEIINALTDGVTFKAPAHMSGPSVHKFKKQVMDSFESDPKSVVIDFGDVDYIDVHGLVLLREALTSVTEARLAVLDAQQQRAEAAARIESMTNPRWAVPQSLRPDERELDAIEITDDPQTQNDSADADSE